MARVSAGSPACQPPVPALVTRTASDRPRSSIWWANIFSAIGDRQMLPEQMKVTCRGNDTGAALAATSDTEHLAKFADGRDVGQRADRLRVREVVASIAPADHDGVDAVFGRTLDVVGPIADHQHPVGQRLQLGERVRG